MRAYGLSLLFALLFSFALLAVYNVVKHEGAGAAYASITGAIVKPRHVNAAQYNQMARLIKANPENLLKLEGADIRAAFKDPGLVRRDGPTTMWQYRNASCVLDLYFVSGSHDPSIKSMKSVMHYEVRSRDSAAQMQPMVQGCVQGLLTQRRGVQMVSAQTFRKAR